ncbi:hypothetical protein [Aliarcobacter butzleri]|uniref:ORC-CDC6 family AAA ATPase n=1 Tax=Aliarcobacter butzleri TaxID=28197 RepID=UPI003AF334CF
MKKIPLSTFLTQNRIEEKGDDLWGIYVLPINYKSLLEYKKSNHIIGGRGSGKTAFVQYHCYKTILSDRKKIIDNDELSNIGIYFKADSALLAEMFESTMGNLWKPVFHSYFGISIISELSQFLNTFMNSNFQDIYYKELVSKIEVPKHLLIPFNIQENTKFIDLYKILNISRVELNNWLSFTNDTPPFKFNAKTMISEYINLVKEIDIFKETDFFIFIDEFENFSPEQQQLINTWIKHVENKIIYNVTYKKHYEPNFGTLGNENIQERNDYRIIDIDKDVFINSDNFKLMCCEIIINNLQIYFGNKYDFLRDFEENYLSSVYYIKNRKLKNYKQNIYNIVNKILPTYGLEQISNALIADSTLKKKVYASIEDAIKSSDKVLDDFISEDNAKTILNAVLLNRQTLTVNDVYKNFIDNTPKYSHWMETNQLGAILFFYNKFNHKTCPYYGGLDRFLMQSHFNIRHFLELFYKSILELEYNQIDIITLESLCIPVELQANAAKEVSTYEFNRKISSCGNRGFSLKKIADRLGQLFAVKQNDPAQKIAEVNQFSILYGKFTTKPHEDVYEYVDELLKELSIWSVLIEKDITKVYDKLEHNSLKEYRLHPILSSYFGISPRQKRKFEFNMNEIESIFDTKDDLKFEKLHKLIKNYTEDNQETNLLDMINGH